MTVHGRGISRTSLTNSLLIFHQLQSAVEEALERIKDQPGVEG